MDDEIADDDFERQFALRRTDPAKFLALMHNLVERRPDDANSYFSRHQAWTELDRPDLALADLDKSLALEDHYVTQRCKGQVLHEMGRYGEAIAALDRSEQMAPEEWPEALGPLIRADCHARLGNEAAALADCATLPDDHWTPGVFGLPAGNREAVADELRRRAAIAATRPASQAAAAVRRGAGARRAPRRRPT